METTVERTETLPTTRELVTDYLNFFKSRSRDYAALTRILASDLRMVSPLGQFQSAEAFVRDLARDALSIEEIKLKRLIVDDSTACALYEVKSANPEIGTVAITEWFEARDGKIETITSTHDASALKLILSRI